MKERWGSRQDWSKRKGMNRLVEKRHGPKKEEWIKEGGREGGRVRKRGTQQRSVG